MKLVYAIVRNDNEGKPSQKDIYLREQMTDQLFD